MSSDQEREALEEVWRLIRQGKAPLEAIAHAWHRYGIDKERLRELLDNEAS